MLRIVAAISALGILALVLAASFTGNGLSGLVITSDGKSGSLVDGATGETLTLDSVQRDIEWRRDTAKKLKDVK